MNIFKSDKFSREMIILNIIIIVIILSIAIWKFYKSYSQSIERREVIDHKYTELTLNDELNNGVKYMYSPSSEKLRGWQTIRFVELDDKRSFTIRTQSFKLAAKDVIFGNIVKKGVILKKNRNSDTLTVVDDGKEYKFLLIAK